MEKDIIYHGSNVVVPEPKILINGHYKDFGYGFYCTNIEKQAKRWALTKRGASIVNKYDYVENRDLNICTFSEMTEEWLRFVLDCRRGKEHSYDIVEGPMADDQIYNYVADFMNGIYTREQFWVMAKFKYPTNQIVFCTSEALKCITHKGFEEV